MLRGFLQAPTAANLSTQHWWLVPPPWLGPAGYPTDCGLQELFGFPWEPSLLSAGISQGVTPTCLTSGKTLRPCCSRHFCLVQSSRRGLIAGPLKVTGTALEAEVARKPCLALCLEFLSAFSCPMWIDMIHDGHQLWSGYLWTTNSWIRTWRLLIMKNWPFRSLIPN